MQPPAPSESQKQDPEHMLTSTPCTSTFHRDAQAMFRTRTASVTPSFWANRPLTQAENPGHIDEPSVQEPYQSSDSFGALPKHTPHNDMLGTMSSTRE
eukprot:2017993-Amphidinium_carterae.3